MQASPSKASGPLTQKQIAEHLGVSRQLVGHALRGDGRVAESTRKQILELAHAQGYHAFSNQEARQMIARRYGKRPLTGIIAALFQPSFDSRPLTAIPFFMSFFDGLEQESNRRGLDLMLCPVRWPELPRLVQSRQVDGLISVGLPREYHGRLEELRLPYVSLNDYGSHGLNLLVDSRPAMAQIAAHLLQLGHRRIAFCGFDGEQSRRRVGELQEYLSAAGHSLDPALVDISAVYCSFDEGQDAAARLLAKSNRFTALVCINDPMAMGAYTTLRAHGLRVPHDVSLIGFDDVSASYNFQPRLTSASFDRQQMGERAISLLWDRAHNHGAEPFEPGQELFASSLVLHDSTAPAPQF